MQQLSASELKRMYPLLNLRDLEIHVKREGRRHYERKAARAAATTLPLRYRSRTPVKLRGRSHTPTKRAYEKCHLQEADHVKSSRHEAIPSSSSHQKEEDARSSPDQSDILPRSKRPRREATPSPGSQQKVEGTRRDPGQPDTLPQCSDKSIPANPIILRPGGFLCSREPSAECSDEETSASTGETGESTDEDESSESSNGSRASAFTIIASDESEASAYGLRSTLHDADNQDLEECELSDSSSHDNHGMPMAERDKVAKWREEKSLENNEDFAYYYTEFTEAYGDAGKAVAMAWVRARALAVPGMASDMARISRVESLSAMIQKVDHQRKNSGTKKKLRSMPSASFLRQPGKGAEMEEEEADKVRFIQPLAQLMMDCKVGREDNTSATDEELMISHVRRATRVVSKAETPTLQRAITTAAEIAEFLASREKPMEISNLEPLVLEHFLHKSQSQVRATNAAKWLNKNLQLGWPLDKVEEPRIKKASHIGMECNQALTAEPSMLQALEEKLIAAAEQDDPTWLAPVASWLQAMGNLRLVHVTYRSVPVELFSDWILFFCKRGKQQHNRSGFYWGVPRTTSNGFDWTVKFLAGYKKRRDSKEGKHMMGMIFRTDDHQSLSQRAILAITKDAVSGIINNPEKLTTYSWRRILPTLGLKCNFSKPERLALGDWKDAKATGDEAPITLRYAGGKPSMSKTCKLICADVLSTFSKLKIQTFEAVPPQQWVTIAAEARARVESGGAEITSLWRNPDIVQAAEGFQVKKSHMNFPVQINGVPLAPRSRDGQNYCVEFQYSRCKKRSCQLGLHRCAAVFRSGRVCHGTHPGGKCRSSRSAIFCRKLPCCQWRCHL